MADNEREISRLEEELDRKEKEFEDIREEQFSKRKELLEKEITKVGRQISDAVFYKRDLDKLVRIHSELDKIRAKTVETRTAARPRAMFPVTRKETPVAPTVPAPVSQKELKEISNIQSEIRDIFLEIGSNVNDVLRSIEDKFGSIEKSYEHLSESSSAVVKRLLQLRDSSIAIGKGQEDISGETIANQIKIMKELQHQTRSIEEFPREIDKSVDELNESLGNSIKSLGDRTERLKEITSRIASHDIAEEVVAGFGRSAFGEFYDVVSEGLKSLTGTNTALEALGKAAKPIFSFPKWMLLLGRRYGKKLYRGIVSVPGLLANLQSHVESTEKYAAETSKSSSSLSKDYMEAESRNVKLLSQLRASIDFLKVKSADGFTSITDKLSAFPSAVSEVKDATLSISRDLSRSSVRLLQSLSGIREVTGKGFNWLSENIESISDDLNKIKKQQKKQIKATKEAGETGFLGSIMGGMLGFRGITGIIGTITSSIAAAITGIGKAIVPMIVPALATAFAGAVGVAIGKGIDNLTKKFVGEEGLGGWVYEKIHGKEKGPPPRTAYELKMIASLKKKMSPAAWEKYRPAIEEGLAAKLIQRGALVRSDGKLVLPEELTEPTEVGAAAPAPTPTPVPPPTPTPTPTPVPPIENIVQVKAPPIVPPEAPPPPPPPQTIVHQTGPSKTFEERSIRGFPVIVDDLGLILANSGLL